MRKVKSLARRSLVPEELARRRPALDWFRLLAKTEDPVSTLPIQELPFSAYLITGTAGSGKSTSIQSLYEALNCTVTGATRLASQAVYEKLNAQYFCRRVNTVYFEFGFRSHHVAMSAGRHVYQPASDDVAELQKRDLCYYWDVVRDITEGALAETENKKERDKTVSRLLTAAAAQRRDAHRCLCFLSSGTPNLIKSSTVVVDEAGLLSRHLLTALVYGWWLLNAVYDTVFYRQGRVPTVVLVGSPTQTNSLESNFEHPTQRHSVRASENILSYLICNPAMARYVELSDHWTIFINNKRCCEMDFANVLKVLEFGLPVTDEAVRYLDQFVESDAYIMNPANLTGWTRLFLSHEEAKGYTARLHNHLRESPGGRYLVFSLPMYVFVSVSEFESYRRLTGRAELTLERWLDGNLARLNNYSQFRDLDLRRGAANLLSNDEETAVAVLDISHVLHSSVSVTTKLRKYMVGYEGTWRGFERALMDDAFLKARASEHFVKRCYAFLALLVYNGMARFYEWLASRDPSDADALYRSLASLTPQPETAPIETEAEQNGLHVINVPPDPEEDEPFEDELTRAFQNQTIDLFYLNYVFRRDCDDRGLYDQFRELRDLYVARYRLLTERFGDQFADSPFVTFVNNVTEAGAEIKSRDWSGGLLGEALQTEDYVLRGWTATPVPLFQEELRNRRPHGAAVAEAGVPSAVLRDEAGFVSVMSLNVCDLVDTVEDRELRLSTSVDHGLSSKLAMTVACSQGLSLGRVAIRFPLGGRHLKMSHVYVAVSRVISSRYLRMNLNPLRQPDVERNQTICEYILRALRDGRVGTVY